MSAAHSRPSDIPRHRERSDSYNSLYGHPAATRASLVQRAEDMVRASSPAPERKRSSVSRPRHSTDSQNGETLNSSQQTIVDDQEEEHHYGSRSATPVNERTPLIRPAASLSTEIENWEADEHSHSHGGHSHGGSMNMKALLLHVLGDALGNVGVIATGLIIWLTSWKFKFYCDPLISLVITAIIFHSALPLGMFALTLDPCWYLQQRTDNFPVSSSSYSAHHVLHPAPRRPFGSLFRGSPQSDP